jgi:diaminohydroxyphosphoribosylaminopyrimidine deaminase/5-amino-6-(5-phosphoribosylamino)uracil reductase
MRGLAAREVLHVVCEGGGRLAEALVRAELVDEFILFYGPSLLGRDGRAGLDGPGWCMDQRPALRMVAVERVGHDLMIRARPKAGAK